MLTEIFKAVLIMSAVGGMLTVLLLAVKPLTRRLFGTKWQFYVWLSVLIVMICPVKIENKVSLPRPIEQSIRTVSVREIPTVSVFEDYSGVYMTEEQPSSRQKSHDWVEFASAVWLTVMATLLVKTVVCNILLKRSLYKTSTYCREFGKACIRESEAVGAPLLLGWLKPVLYVPTGMCEGQEMSYILAHEGVHLKRNDICIKWAAALIKCIHWFNPLVYVVARRIDEACEVSCDTEATRKMDEAEKQRYMQVILNISLNEINFRKTPAAGLSTEGRSLQKRFDAIKKPGKKSRLMYAFGIAVIATVTAGSVYLCGIVRGSAADAEDPALLVLVVPKNNNAVKEPSIVTQDENPEDTAEKSIDKDTLNVPVKEADSVNETAQESVEKVSAPESAPKKIFQGEFNSSGGDTRLVSGVQSDADGCINVEIHSNAQEAVDIFIIDAESGRDVYSFSMPVPNEAAYCIDGLEPGRMYDIVLKGTMRNNWNIESEYIIY